MTISKILFDFAKRVNKVDVLNNPQKYLGLHTDRLLEFWSSLDTLTEEQLNTIDGLFWDFYRNQRSDWTEAVDVANKAADEANWKEFTLKAVWDARVVYNWAAGYATLEIIGGVENPVFLKMFDDV